MDPHSRSNPTVQFGVFELDPQARELYRNGRRVEIQEQPLELLIALLERPGEIVTREELRARIWPEDTFVDFDHSLSMAVLKIRQALKDSYRDPHFLETIPKRGYRFAGRIETPTSVDASRTSRGGISTPSRRRIPLSRLPWIIVPAAILVAGIWLSRWTRTPALPSLVPFTSYLGSEFSPSFSPDGNEIAFCWDGDDGANFDIYRKRIGPGEPLRLTAHPAADYCPSWSPDGGRIAFLRAISPGRAAVVTVPSLGGVERRLTEIDVEDGFYFACHCSAPAWSPDGEWLLIPDRSSDAESFSLFRVSVRSGDRRSVTFTSTASLQRDRYPVVSPDGRTAVFIRGGRVYSLALSPDGNVQGEPKELPLDGGPLRLGAWLPSGKEILFTWALSAGRPIYRAPLPVRQPPTPLPYTGNGAGQPAVSRSGDRLAYVALGANTNIWRFPIPAAGAPSSPPIRFASSTKNDAQPRWSPDGRRVAFGSRRSGNGEIWVCDSDGMNTVQLTNFNGKRLGYPGWSPDSTFLVFNSERNLFLIKAEGGEPKRLSTGVGGGAAPSWSTGGEWIYFNSKRSGSSQVWKIPVDGGEPVQLTKEGGTAAFESPRGDYLYYAKGRGVTSIWRVPVNGGEERQVVASMTNQHSFAVVADGIYFIPGDGRSIQFRNLMTGETKPIASIDLPAGLGLTVSPDQRWLLYPLQDQMTADLMLVENFR